MQHFDTLVEAINGMKSEGYTHDFNLKSNCLECMALKLEIQTEEFVVDKMFRFEGESNPDDSSVLYAISSENHHIKGILIDAYGAYSDAISPEMIEKLRFRN